MLERDRGAALLITVITILGLLLFMFITIQTVKSRADGMHQMYLTYQTAQAAYANGIYGQTAFDSAFWVPYLDGATLSEPTYAAGMVTQNIDLDNDGTDDTVMGLEFLRGPAQSLVFTASYDRTSNFLSGLLGILEDVNLITRVKATSAGTFINLSVDFTNYWLRINAYTQLASKFGADLSVLPPPDSEAQKLPDFLTGRLLHEPDPNNPGSYITNCLARGKIAPIPDPWFGMTAVNTAPSNMPGIPGGENAFCRYPWNPQNPSTDPATDDCCGTTNPGDGCTAAHMPYGGQCPSQRILNIWRSNFFSQYKKGLEVLLQLFSTQENHLRLSVFGGPTRGGNIAQNGDNGPLYGDFELFDGRNMYRETVDPEAMGLRRIEGDGTDAVTCPRFAVDNPVNVKIGAHRRHEWTGRIDAGDLPQIAVNNSINDSRGHKYLKPLDYAFDPASFDNLRVGPNGFINENHPAFVGFQDFGYPNTTALYVPPVGKISDSTFAWPDQTWPTMYSLFSDGTLDKTDPFINEDVSHYAPGLFAEGGPIYGGRDLRGVFQHALDECNAKKALYGDALNCYHLVLAGKEPDLLSTGRVPDCTTAAPVAHAAHMALITADLNSIDAVENVASILVHIGPDYSPAPNPVEVQDVLDLFNNTTYPKRFLVNLKATLVSGISPRLVEVVNSLSHLTRERPIMRIE